MRLFRRFLGFGVSPLVSMIAPFLALPLVARVASAAEWSGIAIGQSAGTIVATVVAYGWALRGVVEAASSSSSEERRQLWSEFVTLGVPLAMIANIVMAPIVIVASPSGAGVAAVAMAVATASTGLAPSWYSIGIGSARQLFWFTTAPRVVGTALGAIAAMLTGNVIMFPLLLLVGNIAGPIVFSIVVHRPSIVAWRTARTRLRRNLAAASATTLDSLYSGGFMLAAGLFAPPEALAAIASGDRLFRFAKQGANTLTNALQAWIAVGPGAIAARQRRSVLLHLGLGLVGGAVFAAAAAPASRLLFGEAVATTRHIGYAYGVAFIATSVGSALAKHVLAVIGQDRAVVLSTVVGCVVGLVALVLFGSETTGLGAAGAYAATEIAVLSARLWAWRARSLPDALSAKAV